MMMANIKYSCMPKLYFIFSSNCSVALCHRKLNTNKQNFLHCRQPLTRFASGKSLYPRIIFMPKGITRHLNVVGWLRHNVPTLLSCKTQSHHIQQEIKLVPEPGGNDPHVSTHTKSSQPSYLESKQRILAAGIMNTPRVDAEGMQRGPEGNYAHEHYTYSTRAVSQASFMSDLFPLQGRSGLMCSGYCSRTMTGFGSSRTTPLLGRRKHPRLLLCPHPA